MQNMNDIRSKITEFADEAGVPQKYFIEFMEDFDRIVGGGTEVFEVHGFSDMFYNVYKIEDDRWSWTFIEPGEFDEHASQEFPTRREAMLDAARDSDETMLVDGDLGSRIRRAI